MPTKWEPRLWSCYGVNIMVPNGLMTQRPIKSEVMFLSPVCMKYAHDSDVTWASERFKSTTTRQFVQQIIQANIKENIKDPRYRTFVRRIQWWPVNSPHRGPVTWKPFPCYGVFMVARGKCVYFDSIASLLSHISLRMHLPGVANIRLNNRVYDNYYNVIYMYKASNYMCSRCIENVVTSAACCDIHIINNLLHALRCMAMNIYLTVVLHFCTAVIVNIFPRRETFSYLPCDIYCCTPWVCWTVIGARV